MYHRPNIHPTCRLQPLRRAQFKCKYPAPPTSSRPPRSLPALPGPAPATPPTHHKSDPPKRAELAADTTSASQGAIPTVVMPPLGSILGRRPPSSMHTSQEVDELVDSPVLPKRRRTNTRPRLVSSSPPMTPPRLPSLPPRPSSPQFPSVSEYFEYLIPTTHEPIPPNVLGRAGHPHSIFPELVVPASIVDLTPEFAHRRGSYWRVDAEKIPWTRDGYLQVQASIHA